MRQTKNISKNGRSNEMPFLKAPWRAGGLLGAWTPVKVFYNKVVSTVNSLRFLLQKNLSHS
jgi:hypothetical protein